MVVENENDHDTEEKNDIGHNRKHEEARAEAADKGKTKRLKEKKIGKMT